MTEPTSVTSDYLQLVPSLSGAPRYEQIAVAIEAAIERGAYRIGEQLPTVRALASQLGVSGASVAVAYGQLARRGRVHARVGRGTFVSPPPPAGGSESAADATGAGRALPRRAADRGRSPLTSSWRRRALRLSDRLRAVYPDAIPCTVSWPDPALLPADILKRAYRQTISQMQAFDLQYAGPEPAPELVQAVLPRFARDGVSVTANDLVVMTSIKQVLGLTLRIAPMLVEGAGVVVAVEDPGYHTALDEIESLGHRLVGVEVDGQGAVPASLKQVLERGVSVVMLTPRALNPTGASWTPERRAALADVLAEYPRVVTLEDDHFADLASTAPGSLFDDARLEGRVVHARSFSQAIAPDSRLTIVAARGRLRALLRDAKLVTDGSSSRLAQRVLAAVLDDDALPATLQRARDEYAARRAAVTGALLARLPASSVALPTDGVNIWVWLPNGLDPLEVMHNAAELGVLVSSGDAFSVRPGGNNAVRLSVGWIESAEEAGRAGDLLASAILTADDLPISVVI